jgi:hypothetical protein
MELVFSAKEKHGGCLMPSRVQVVKGKVTSATPSLGWSVGEGLHVVLSWAARRQITWKKCPSKTPPGQLELAL